MLLLHSISQVSSCIPNSLLKVGGSSPGLQGLQLSQPGVIVPVHSRIWQFKITLCDPSTEEEEAEVSSVPGQPGLHCKILSHKAKTEQQNFYMYRHKSCKP